VKVDAHETFLQKCYDVAHNQVTGAF